MRISCVVKLAPHFHWNQDIRTLPERPFVAPIAITANITPKKVPCLFQARYKQEPSISSNTSVEEVIAYPREPWNSSLQHMDYPKPNPFVKLIIVNYVGKKPFLDCKNYKKFLWTHEQWTEGLTTIDGTKRKWRVSSSICLYCTYASNGPCKWQHHFMVCA